jgi:hypothetical protein
MFYSRTTNMHFTLILFELAFQKLNQILKFLRNKGIRNFRDAKLRSGNFYCDVQFYIGCGRDTCML